ncbi:MAG: response regulator [Proteobacteria bacterium]|nr:response regulator [Pseudomonadota bacterium]
MTSHDPITILMADDDPDDQILVRDAFAVNRLAHNLQFVDSGQDLMDYLDHQGRFPNPALSPRPDIILLDLNMPGMDGREALDAIKSDPRFRTIPIVVLTTSSEEKDIRSMYDLGANSYIVKPMGFEALVRAIASLGSYWLDIVRLPLHSADGPAGR